MRSVIQGVSPDWQGGVVKLFKSYRKEYADGEQVRDFIAVEDAVAVTLFAASIRRRRGCSIAAQVRRVRGMIWPRPFSPPWGWRRTFSILRCRRRFAANTSILRRRRWANCGGGGLRGGVSVAGRGHLRVCPELADEKLKGVGAMAKNPFQKLVSRRSRLAAFALAGALALIAGPCVIESRTMALDLAARLAALARREKIPLVFKASYDKANRTSIGAFRGPGLAKGWRFWRKSRRSIACRFWWMCIRWGKRRRRKLRIFAVAGFFVPANRFGCGAGRERARGEHQEGAISGAVGCAPRD